MENNIQEEQKLESTSIPTVWKGITTHPIENWLDDMFMEPGKFDFFQKPYLWIYRYLYSFPKDSIHQIKNYYLRKRYGAGCCDVFSFDYYLAKQICPGLKLFRTKVGGYPYKDDEQVNSVEKWRETIDEMIYAFQSYEDEEDINFVSPKWEEGGKERADRIQKGFELFGKYYQDLWY